MRSYTKALYFFSFFLFFGSIFCQTPAIIQKIQSFNEQFKYSIIPSQSATVVFWWTPDSENNQIHFGVMGAENAYAAFGFNNNTSQFDHMTNGYAVIAIQNNVTLYYLGGQYVGPGGVGPVADQSNIKETSYLLQDGFIFTQFTWVLTDPVKFDMKQNQTVIWSSRNYTSDPVLQYHDKRGFLTLNFLNPGPITPVSVCLGCLYGACAGSDIWFLGKCSCAHSFTPESNCTLSNHQFNHTFYTQSKLVILQMFWTLDFTKGLAIDIRKPITPTGSANQWAGIGFSGPQGQMAGTDAVVFPDANGMVSAFYINKKGFDGLVAPMISIRNISYSFLGENTFFGFSRDLTDGKNALTDPHEVYMVAVASDSVPFSSHIVHDLYSSGADSINLESGGTLPPKFFWTNMVTHGFLMWLCWSIIIPIGFLWARFVKGYPDDKSALWFEGHRTLMSVGFIIVLISAIYAIAQVETHVDSVHKILGVTVITGALYQVMSAVMRPHADPSNPSRQRLLFEYTHHTIGRLAILLAWVAIAFGLLLIPGVSMTVIYIHVVISIVWLFLAIALEVRKYIVTRRNHEYERVHK